MAARICFVTLVGAALLALTGCGWMPSRTPATVTADAPALKAIRVGMAAKHPPLSYVEKGEVKGIEVDLARRLAADTGMRVTLLQMPREQLIPALQSGKIDVIMAGMAITEALEQKVSFATPYLRTGQVVLIREQDVNPLALPESLRAPGRRIGVVRGTSGEQTVRTKLPLAQVAAFTRTGEGVRALKAGRVDYFIDEETSIWRFGMEENPNNAGLVALYTPLVEEDLAWAVRKRDTKLKEKLDAEVASMKQRGVIDAIVGRWVKTEVEVAKVPMR